MYSTLTLLYDYHYWANGHFLDACAVLTPEQWSHPMGHSWGTVHGLLGHLVVAEDIWFTRILEGVSPRVMPQPEHYPTLVAIRARLAYWEARATPFIAQCDNARLAADLHYTNTKGLAYHEPLGQLLLHVANHGTHHRGELAGMLTLLNVPHPEDDLLFYLRSKEGNK